MNSIRSPQLLSTNLSTTENKALFMKRKPQIRKKPKNLRTKANRDQTTIDHCETAKNWKLQLLTTTTYQFSQRFFVLVRRRTLRFFVFSACHFAIVTTFTKEAVNSFMSVDFVFKVNWRAAMYTPPCFLEDSNSNAVIGQQLL